MTLAIEEVGVEVEGVEDEGGIAEVAGSFSHVAASVEAGPRSTGQNQRIWHP